jgi:hypothetical protein
MAEDTEQIYQLQKIAVRAPGLDDMRNKLAAFVASGKSGLVENLIYVTEKQFNELNKPAYITITIENGGRLHDF